MASRAYRIDFVWHYLRAFGILSSERFRRNSKHIADAAQEQIKSLQQGLGAVRDVLLDANQDAYVENYRNVDRIQNKSKQRISISGLIHASRWRHLVLYRLLCWVVPSHEAGGYCNCHTTSGALALGAQRLLPALQQIYSSWATLKGADASLIEVLEMLEQPLPELICATNPVPPLKSSFKRCLFPL